MFGTREVEISPATPVSLTTLAEVKTALGISGSGQDGELTAIIAEASASIEKWCGTILGERTVTERHFLEEGGSAIMLDYAPATSLTSVHLKDDAQSVADYRLSNIHGTLRKVDRSHFEASEYKIVYEAGYAEGSVPPAIARAALEYVKSLYNSKGANDDVLSESTVDVGETTFRSVAARTLTANGVALPNRVALMLAPYRRVFAR